MSLLIKYDIEKDAANYKYSLIDNAYPRYGRDRVKILPTFMSNLKLSLEKTNNDDKKMRIIRSYLQNNYSDNFLMELSVQNLTKAWSVIGKKYITRLIKYFQITSYKEPEITCYLTTLKLCPYSQEGKYFYTPFYANIADQIRIIMHEMMHIVFLDNYKEYLIDRGISEQSILEINESLTVLLNLEFKELLPILEENKKPSIADLQQIVINGHDKKTPFCNILERLIEARI